MPPPPATQTNITNAIDAVQMTGASVPRSGFFTNPDFSLEFQYWKIGSTSGYVERNADIQRKVMVMRKGQELRQNILHNVELGQQYKIRFLVNVQGADQIDMRIRVRLRFRNNDLENGPRNKVICNFFSYALRKKIQNTGGWQHIATDKFDMFDSDIMPWDGTVDFILFQMYLTPKTDGRAVFSWRA